MKEEEMSYDDEHDDPEASYRRGYLQGAHDTVEAFATGSIAPPRIATMRDWVGQNLWRWRYRKPITNRNLRPPRPTAAE